MLEYSEAEGVIKLVSPMPAGRRLLFALLALFPLIAPYELLIKPHWEEWLHPAFFFAAAIALGAIALSLFLLFAALAGLEQRFTFDIPAGEFTYWRRAPILPARSRVWTFDSITGVDLIVHEWSDGPDSYSVRVLGPDGISIDSGSTDSRTDVERYVSRLREILEVAVAS